MPIEGLDPVHSAQLCAYQQGEGGFDLVYAGTLDEAAAQALYAGDGLGSKAARDFCDSKFEEYVLVRFSGKDAMGDAELTADWVVDPGCQQVEVEPRPGAAPGRRRDDRALAERPPARAPGLHRDARLAC